MPDGKSFLRYRRQTVLPEVGEAGQARLARASVLVVGAGGLGSPVLMYLAAAGVGRLGIVDADVVDETNRNRQIVHAAGSVGMRKIDSAAEALARLAPETEIVRHGALLTAANAEELVRGHDAAAGCVDNFPARYALNKACVALGVPNVFGAAEGFTGQVSVFGPPGPCYRCFFREAPPEDRVVPPEEKGIIGPAAGIIGSMMAVETLKILLGAGETLRGRLFLMDALAGTFRTIAVRRDPECPECSGLRACY